MSQHRDTVTVAAVTPHPAAETLARAAPVALAVLFGLFLLAGAGFAGSEVVHNAAHDGRHSFALPCH